MAKSFIAINYKEKINDLTEKIEKLAQMLKEVQTYAESNLPEAITINVNVDVDYDRLLT